MHNDEIRSIVERLAALVSEHYVFPDVGQEVAARLRTAASDGRYDVLTDPEQLAAQVTADLQIGNQDKHLRLKFHRGEIPDEADPVAEEQHWADRARLDAGGVARVERLAGNIGLLEIRPLLYHPVHAGAAVSAAMSLLAATDALLLDLRGCLGGSPEQVAFVCSHLFDAEPVHLNDQFTPATGTVRQYWTSPVVGPRFGGSKPIWVLTSGSTFSGGEELTYDLQQLGRARIVGERTGGGAHPREGFKLHAHLEATVPVQRAVNPVSGTNWEGVGVLPDLEVPAAEAFDTAYREAVEHVLTLPAEPARLGVEEEARAVVESIPVAG
jgi:C-terminal processing protease CtpA/Prc